MILEEETYRKFGYYPEELAPKSTKKVICSCDYCGKIVEKIRSQAEKYKHHFCDNKCQGQWQSKEVRGKKSSGWKGGKIKRVCEICGKEFKVIPSLLKRGGGRFCSPQCMGKWQSDENNPRWKGGELKRICEQCGKRFKIEPYRANKGQGRFCSTKCMGEWYSKSRKGESNPAWKGGLSFEPYCHKFNNEFKEYIRDKFGRVCFLCPTTEEENGERLSVHHVNYDKECLCNDNLTCQFIPLCRSCNAKVNSNREEWEKKIKQKMQNKLNGWYI